MKQYTLIIKLNVADCWIADGFNPSSAPTQEAIEESIESVLGYANVGEITAKIVDVRAPKFTLGELEELGLI